MNDIPFDRGATIRGALRLNNNPDDWPCGLIAGNARLRARAAPWGRPYIAKITGPDPTYRWKRVFVKTAMSRVASGVDDMECSVVSLAPLPTPIEVRWGPRSLNVEGEATGLCAWKSFFCVSDKEPFFWRIDEVSLRAILESGSPEKLLIEPPRLKRARAPIAWDEEV